MGYGLASSPISLALRARLPPKPIALAGHRHHSACQAYKLERLGAKKSFHRPASTGLLHRINPKPIEAAEKAYRAGYGRAIGIPENGGIALEGSRRL